MKSRLTRQLNGTCAMALALAATGIASPAPAQSFNGTPTVVSGSASVFTSPGTTQVYVNTAETVINWTVPTSAAAGNPPVVFQPQGTTASFYNSSETSLPISDYTVLNRVLPTEAQLGTPVPRPVQFDGTVESFFTTFNEPDAPGGRIWFYSPTGIIAGPTSRFNVGSLLLTTNDVDTTGGLYGSGGEIRLRGPAGSTGFVDVQRSATDQASLNALGAPSNAYLAIVAPRVVQAGTVSSNGAITYGAAEQADLIINAGSLDIVVTHGTTDPNGIVHTGTTTGPASTSAADRQVIQMVAIPKNTALTMLLSGAIGYAAAASAAQEGSAIVLSAGVAPNIPADQQALGLGNMEIGNTVFYNPVTGDASNTIAVAPTGGLTNFQAGATLTALRTVSVTAEDGEVVRSDAELLLRAVEGTTGGVATVTASGTGQVIVTQELTVNADGGPAPFSRGPAGLDGIGGTARVEALGGSVNAGTLTVTAQGIGSGASLSGGNGTGGTAELRVAGSGSVTAALGTTSVRASGRGGSSGGAAGDGVGGTVRVLEQGGTLNLGALQLNAEGSGGNAFGSDSGPGQAGDGTGGAILVSVETRPQTWTSLIASSKAEAGETFSSTSLAGSAAGRADGVTLRVTGAGALTVDDLDLNADAIGAIDGAAGFSAVAGGVSIDVNSGASLSANDSFRASAQALLSGGDGNSTTAANTTPRLQGGTVSVLANNGTITTPELIATTSAEGISAMTTAGTATGGTTTVGASSGGTIRVDNGTGAAAIAIDANGYGASGPAPADAFGGSATLYADGGTIDLRGPTSVTASALASSYEGTLSGPGFDALGGTATVELRAGGGSMTLGTLNVEANGIAQATGAGAPAIAGDGGNGIGGSSLVSIAAGTFSAPQVTVRSEGRGGRSSPNSSGTPYVSGDGQGGTARFAQTGGSATTPTLSVLAQGFGGGSAVTTSGAPPSLAGNGIGGTAIVTLSGGTLNTPALLIDAVGTGGAGMNVDSIPGSNGGDGGSGTGGSASLVGTTGGTATATIGSLTARADGIGGAGGTSTSGARGIGSSGTGGAASVGLTDSRFTIGPVIAQANGTGGAGRAGGSGSAGTASFIVDDSVAGALAPRQMSSLTLLANGTGGASDAGPAGAATAGATGLRVRTLSPAAGVTITGNFTAQALGMTIPAGDGFTGSIAGAPLTIGGNALIDVSRNIAFTIDPGSALNVGGTLTMTTPGSIVGSGLVTSGGNAALTAPLGITITDLHSGGTTLLRAVNGAVAVSRDLRSTGPVTVLGRSVDLVSLAGLSFADADATAGNLSVRTAGQLDATTVDATGAVTLASTGAGVATSGAVNGASIALSAGTNIAAAGTLTAPGAITASAGGTVTTSSTVSGGSIALTAGTDITSATLSSGGPVSANAGRNIAINGPVTGSSIALIAGSNIAAASTLTAPGAITASAGGNVATSGTVSGGSIALTAGGDITSAALSAGGPVSANAGRNLAITGSVAGSTIALAAGTNITTAGTLTAPGTITANAGGNVTTSGTVSGGSIALTAGTDITSATVNSAGPVSASAGRNLAISGPVSGSSIALIAGANITAANSLTASGAVTANAGGSVTTSGSVSGGSIALAAGTDIAAVSLNSSGAVSANAGRNVAISGPVTGSSVALTAGSNINAAGNLTAAGALVANAGGTFQLDGVGAGQTIAVTSGDIVLGAAARLGTRGTTRTIELTNGNAANRTFIGGSPTTGYGLSAAEAARLFADQAISVRAAGAAPADVIVGSVALSYGPSANIGAGGVLKIDTAGRVAVIGAVQLTTLSAADRFFIDPTRIDVIAETGSIAMRTAAGAPLGQLELIGGTIAVAGQATLDQIAATGDTRTITRLLDAPLSSPAADGPLVAGDILLQANDAAYIQNTGSGLGFADRRGFTARSLEIVTQRPSTRISVNGQILRDDGAAITGLNTAREISINGVPGSIPGGDFDPLSTINGCIIGSGCGFAVPQRPETPEPGPPGQRTGVNLIEVAPEVEDNLAPLVDEPVTGVGNDDLWQGRCEARDEEGRCREGDKVPD